MSRAKPVARHSTSAIPWAAALRGAVGPGALKQTTVAALLVGGTLLMVNLYSSLSEGPVTWGLGIKVFLTFFVPWMNATMGVALGLRKSAQACGEGFRPGTGPFTAPSDRDA